MIEDIDKNKIIENELDDICEECKKEDNSVTENLILTGYKLCKSCKIIKNFISNLTYSAYRQSIHSTHDKRDR